MPLHQELAPQKESAGAAPTAAPAADLIQEAETGLALAEASPWMAASNALRAGDSRMAERAASTGADDRAAGEK